MLFFISILRIWRYFYVEFQFILIRMSFGQMIMKKPSVLQTWLPNSQLETLPLHKIAGCQGKLHWKLQTTDSQQLDEFIASSWKIYQQRRYRFIIFCRHECISICSSSLLYSCKDVRSDDMWVHNMLLALVEWEICAHTLYSRQYSMLLQTVSSRGGSFSLRL